MGINQLLVIVGIGIALVIAWILYKLMDLENRLNKFKDVIQDILNDIDMRFNELEKKEKRSKASHEKVRSSKKRI